MLHDDNATSRRAVVTRECLLAPCDFFLLPKMLLQLKYRRFDTVKEIQRESQKVLDTLDSDNDSGSIVSLHKGTILKWMVPKLQSCGERNVAQR